MSVDRALPKHTILFVGACLAMVRYTELQHCAVQ